MRKKFEQQKQIGFYSIEDIEVDLKSRDSFSKLVLALQKMYTTDEYRNRLFEILENKILKNKRLTGRTGMNLWQIFVLAQTRLCLNLTYDRLHHMVNNDRLLRQLLGIESIADFDRVRIEYQNILDNIKLLDDNTLIDINKIIVEMGYDVFKKKETAPLYLKTDSFVVKSNVHYPTDYNLLWDSGRKCCDMIERIVKENPEIKGWRNLKNWYKKLKNKCRELSQAGKKTKEVKLKIVTEYLEKARLFHAKIVSKAVDLFVKNQSEKLQNQFRYYIQMLEKHIDLVDRRLVKDETIPHAEKVFSIFEQYTEWIVKGKQNPSFELGKNVAITTDQFHLIIDCKIYENEVDKSVLTGIVDAVTARFSIKKWSFDKGFYSKTNKDYLKENEIEAVMPKKGKPNQEEKLEESAKEFKKYRNKHSAVESNINELSYRGLDRCPDRGYDSFKRYIGLGICSYNLHKIGAELRRQQLEPKLTRKAA